MFKIDKNYGSLIYFIDTGYPFAFEVDYAGTWREQMIGALQPLAKIAEDAVMSFQPYRTGFDFRAGQNFDSDVRQPLRGLFNILGGIWFIFSALGFFVLKMGYWAFSNRETSFKAVTKVACSWFLEGLCTIIRGATQIAATPLTYAIRIPLRLLLTEIKGKLHLEDDMEIKYHSSNILQKLQERYNYPASPDNWTTQLNAETDNDILNWYHDLKDRADLCDAKSMKSRNFESIYSIRSAEAYSILQDWEYMDDWGGGDTYWVTEHRQVYREELLKDPILVRELKEYRLPTVSMLYEYVSLFSKQRPSPSDYVEYKFKPVPDAPAINNMEENIIYINFAQEKKEEVNTIKMHSTFKYGNHIRGAYREIDNTDKACYSTTLYDAASECIKENNQENLNTLFFAYSEKKGKNGLWWENPLQRKPVEETTVSPSNST